MQERKRRKVQLQELNAIIESNETQDQNIHDSRRKKAKWDRYMRCDGSSDPTIPGEINTYMNLWRDDNERVSIEQVLKDSELTLSVSMLCGIIYIIRAYRRILLTRVFSAVAQCLAGVFLSNEAS
jgi:hypothetical protein